MIRKSGADQKATVARLLAAVERRELTVFAHVDHAEHAHRVGLELPPTDVLVFGNPRAGTPLMAADPRVAIDLPLRMLVWEDASGLVFVGHHDPRELTAGYELAEHQSVLERMADLLDAISVEAAGS